MQRNVMTRFEFEVLLGIVKGKGKGPPETIAKSAVFAPLISTPGAVTIKSAPPVSLTVKNWITVVPSSAEPKLMVLLGAGAEPYPGVVTVVEVTAQFSV